MAVRAHGFGPVAFREDGSVVVQAEREVVLDQILARHPQVEGVPELELVLHRRQLLLRHRAVLGNRLVEEDRIPHILQQPRR